MIVHLLFLTSEQINIQYTYRYYVLRSCTASQVDTTVTHSQFHLPAALSTVGGPSVCSVLFAKTDKEFNIPREF